MSTVLFPGLVAIIAIGLLGPFIAAAYLAVKLNGRSGPRAADRMQ